MTNDNGRWPSADFVFSALWAGQWYANIRLFYMSRLILLVIVCLCVSLFGNWALANKPPQYRYVLTDAAGIVLNLVPLDQPNHDDRFVMDWTVDAVTRLWTFDYLNYREHFQDAQKNLTTVGWKNFEEGLMQASNFNSIKELQYVLTAAPTGPGEIVKTGDVLGRYAWKVRFPMVISYQSSRTNREGRNLQTTMNLTMDVTVIRVPEYLNPAGISIRAMVGE